MKLQHTHDVLEKIVPKINILSPICVRVLQSYVLDGSLLIAWPSKPHYRFGPFAYKEGASSLNFEIVFG